VDERQVATQEGQDLVRSLAEFRYQLRRFLQFSEQAAHQAHLQPQQHQLLLQVAGAAEGTQVTIAYAAERLGLRHNSVVELVNRSVGEGLLVRHKDSEDARCVLLDITSKGRRILRSLSEYHARELNELAPQLIRALKHVQQLDFSTTEKSRRGIA
jgi:DNA-binding MarR family transcriptional regulator